ncbi:MAG TPA: hypothetical protein PKJ62_01835 [Bacteroidia bacterium]|nr:hypothetical protein [Bacteroidia bacterium]HNS12436.1 hypothetical protein [Bacteroidia bacterium]
MKIIEYCLSATWILTNGSIPKVNRFQDQVELENIRKKQMPGKNYRAFVW